MADRNLSVFLYKKGDLRLEDGTIPEPGRGEVQLAMKAVGVCGSDLHFWTTGAIGKTIVNAPMSLGHEPSGVVSKVGDDVTSLKVGDRVAVEPTLPCRSCTCCKNGRYNICRERKCLGVPPIPGCMSRYLVHPAEFCYRIPDRVSFEEAALLEPLSVAIHACRRVPITLGQKVFIGGAGPIGLLCMLTAKAMGAVEVCISDLCEPRLQLAKRLGAEHTLLIESKDATATAETVTRMIGCMVDVTIECSGAVASVQAGVFATRSGGVLMQVGLGDADVIVPLLEAVVREVDIKGSAYYANTFPTAIEMVASGRIDVKPLLTHHFPLEESLQAFETARAVSDGAAKVIIHCDRDWKH